MIIGDNELIGLYLGSGDVDALNQLVNRHSRLVYGVCRKMLWRAEDAEDAFQIVSVSYTHLTLPTIYSV